MAESSDKNDDTMPAIEDAYYPYRLRDGDIVDAKGRRVTVPGNFGVAQLLNTIVELRRDLADERGRRQRWQEIADQRAVEVADLRHDVQRAMANHNADLPENSSSGDMNSLYGGKEPAWLLFFEDASKPPEIFMGAGAEAAARARYYQAATNWNCHLFCNVVELIGARHFAASSTERIYTKEDAERLCEIAAAAARSAPSARVECKQGNETKALDVLRRLEQWDQFDQLFNSAADGMYWKMEIGKALSSVQPEEREPMVPRSLAEAWRDTHSRELAEAKTRAIPDLPPAYGVTRMGDNDRAVLVSFSSRPTDDELRALHEALAGRS